MAQHPIINPSAEMLPLRIASKALDTAKSMQTRKSASAYYTDIDGNGIIIGSNSADGINRYDPLTGDQTPLWDGVSQEELDAKASEILDGAKASADAQIKQVEATMDEISDAVASNTDAIALEQTLREEGDKAAQATVTAVKAETDKLKGDYADMATDVANVQADIVKLATQTGNLAETTIVRSVVEYAVGTGTTAPTSGWSTATPTVFGSQRAWMRTKVTYGDGRSETTNPVVVTGAQGVSVTAITPFYCIASSKPAQPTNKAPGGAWTTTEPAYVKDKSLYTCQRVDYSNGKWSWTSVQLSSSYGLASVALMTANGKNKRWVQRDAPSSADLQQSDEWWQTSSKPLETYWTGEPNNSPSVLVDHSDEVEHIYVWNGSRWNEQVLSAEHLLVPGSIAVGLVTANFFDGAVIRGGAFVTSNERIQLNNNGFTMVDSAGNPVVTLDAKTGAAVFQSVNIIGAGLSAPSISGGVIEGAEYSLVNGSGASAKTVAKINSTGVYFGDHLTYAKNDAGTWTLSVRGDIQSGSTVSGATVVGASIYTNTQWDSTTDAEKYRGIVITSGGMFAYKNNGTEEYSMAFTADDGTLRLDGSVMANGTLTLPTITGGEVIGSNIHTSTDADNRAEMDANGFRVVSNGETVIAFDVNGTVDVGTSGLASADDVSNLDERLSADIGELDKAVQNQHGALEDEITQRRKYLRFDSSTGLEIGEQATGDMAGCTLRLTPTRMEFRQGDVVAAYVSNDRLNINNAEIINTLTIGKFAFLPRENGHLSLQYVG